MDRDADAAEGTFGFCDALEEDITNAHEEHTNNKTQAFIAFQRSIPQASPFYQPMAAAALASAVCCHLVGSARYRECRFHHQTDRLLQWQPKLATMEVRWPPYGKPREKK